MLLQGKLGSRGDTLYLAHKGRLDGDACPLRINPAVLLPTSLFLFLDFTNFSHSQKNLVQKVKKHACSKSG